MKRPSYVELRYRAAHDEHWARVLAERAALLAELEALRWRPEARTVAAFERVHQAHLRKAVS